MPDSEIDKFIKQRRKAQPEKPPSEIDAFMAARREAPVPTPPEAPGIMENLATGTQRGLLEYVQKPLAAAGEAIYSGIRGDTRPLQEFAEIAGRGLLKQGAGLAGPPGTYEAVSAVQDPQIAQVQAAQQARQEQVDPRLFGQIQQKGTELAQREAADPSTRGKILRGAATLGVGAVPAVVTGIATGGSVPAIAAVTALQSAGDPENLALNVAGSVVPVPVGKAVSPILRRIRASRGTTVSPPPKSGGYTTQTVMVDGELPATVIQTGTPAPPGTVKVRYPDGATVNIKTDRITPVETAAMRATPETAPLDVPPVPTRRERIVSFLDEQEAAARARLQERRNPNVLRDISTVVPDAVDYSIIGAAKFGKGAIKYEQFAEEMLAEFGDEIKPRLRSIYDESKKIYNKEQRAFAQAEKFYKQRENAPTVEELATKGQKPSEVTTAKIAAADAAESPLVQESERTPILQVIVAAVKAGMLSKPTTHLKNLAGTATYQLSEEAKKLPELIADLVVSAGTGRRSVAGPSATSFARSLKAIADARGKAKEILKTGIDPDNAIKEALGSKEINSGSKVVDFLVNGVFRALKAEDKLTYSFAYKSTLDDLARTQAINEGKQGLLPKGQTVSSRAAELRNDPTDQLRIEAMGEAEIRIFANENFTSRFLAAGKEKTQDSAIGRAAIAGLETVVPFTRTPTNIIGKMLQYSPLGFGQNAIQLAQAISKKAFTQADQRKFVQTFGRATTGSALVALGYKLGLAGVATGLYERTMQSRNERDKAAGRPAGSVLVGDRWYPLTSFPPFGNLIAIGASLAREDKQEAREFAQEGTPPNPVPLPLRASFKVATEGVVQQPLLQGAEDVIDIATKPGQRAKAAGQFLAGRAIPGIVGAGAEALDPNQRQAEGFGAQLQRNIPTEMFGYGRESLPPTTDALGQPIQDVGPVQAFTEISRSRQATSNPVLNELIRLDQGLNKVEKKKGEAEDKYRERVGSFGEIYQQFGEQLLGNALYQKATDEQKAKALDSLSRRAKVQVNDEVEKGRRAGPRQARLNPQIIMRAVIDSERAKK